MNRSTILRLLALVEQGCADYDMRIHNQIDLVEKLESSGSAAFGAKATLSRLNHARQLLTARRRALLDVLYHSFEESTPQDSATKLWPDTGPGNTLH